MLLTSQLPQPVLIEDIFDEANWGSEQVSPVFVAMVIFYFSFDWAYSFIYTSIKACIRPLWPIYPSIMTQSCIDQGINILYYFFIYILLVLRILYWKDPVILKQLLKMELTIQKPSLPLLQYMKQLVNYRAFKMAKYCLLIKLFISQ